MAQTTELAVATVRFHDAVLRCGGLAALAVPAATDQSTLRDLADEHRTAVEVAQLAGRHQRLVVAHVIAEAGLA